jgi:hypothetical protein
VSDQELSAYDRWLCWNVNSDHKCIPMHTAWYVSHPSITFNFMVSFLCPELFRISDRLAVSSLPVSCAFAPTLRSKALVHAQFGYFGGNISSAQRFDAQGQRIESTVLHKSLTSLFAAQTGDSESLGLYWDWRIGNVHPTRNTRHHSSKPGSGAGSRDESILIRSDTYRGPAP